MLKKIIDNWIVLNSKIRTLKSFFSRMYVKVFLFTRVISTLSESRVRFPIQNVMAAAFVTMSRLYDRRFPRSGKSRWVGSSNEMLACCTCRYSGVPHWSAGTKRASLWLARLHHILVSTIRETRINISRIFVD